MDQPKTSTGLLAPDVFIEGMLARGFELDDSAPEEGVLEHPDVPGEAFKFPKNRAIRINSWVPINLLVETMQSQGYRLLDSEPSVFLLSHPNRGTHVVGFPAGATELPDVLIRYMLKDEPDARLLMDAVDRRMEKAAAEETEGFGIDLNAALSVLETTPHPRANRSNEDLAAAREILAAIDSETLSGTEPVDLSENLDEYIY